MKRRILILLTTALLAVGFSAVRPALARADNGGADNTAIAVNTKDGSSVFKLAFAIRHVMGDVVDTTNAAVAYASCTRCTTTAIAIEIVLIEGDASTITPTNVALAINVSCTLCVTVAQAYQFVLTTGGPVHFDHEGNKILEEVRARLHDLRKDDLTPEELQAVLDEIKAQILDVLAHHLVPAGRPAENQRSETAPATTTTTPTTTETVQTTTPTITETTTTQQTTTTP